MSPSEHKSLIALHIVKSFKNPVEETPVYSEEDFAKAQEAGEIEVFEVSAVSAFKRKIEKALEENPDASALLEIEKAKRDLSKLVKIQKRDSKGRNMTYYVRATDKAQKDRAGGSKLANTEEGKHYIIHSGNDKIVAKRKGTDAKGTPMFHPVDEHGNEQGDTAHAFHDKGVDKVEPHTELDKKGEKQFKDEPEDKMESRHSNKKKPEFYNDWDEKDLSEYVADHEERVADYVSEGKEVPKILQARTEEVAAMKKNLEGRSSAGKLKNGAVYLGKSDGKHVVIDKDGKHSKYTANEMKEVHGIGGDDLSKLEQKKDGEDVKGVGRHKGASGKLVHSNGDDHFVRQADGEISKYNTNEMREVYGLGADNSVPDYSHIQEWVGNDFSNEDIHSVYEAFGGEVQMNKKFKYADKYNRTTAAESAHIYNVVDFYVTKADRKPKNLSRNELIEVLWGIGMNAQNPAKK